MVINPSGLHARTRHRRNGKRGTTWPIVGTCSDNSYHHHRHHDYYYYSDCGRVHSGASKVRCSTFVSTITPVTVAVVNTTPSSSSSSFVISNIFCICLLHILCKSSTKFRSVWVVISRNNFYQKNNNHTVTSSYQKQPFLVQCCQELPYHIYDNSSITLRFSKWYSQGIIFEGGGTLAMHARARLFSNLVNEPSFFNLFNKF
jgi:hypothetical protein